MDIVTRWTATPWTERVVPHLVDLALNDRVTGGWRAKTTSDVTGDVLELGFGSGINLPHYGATVDRVLAVEPSDVAWQKATGRIAAFGRPVERAGLDGAHLDVADASVDAVVSTWTMCTIPDLAGALAEVRRVLRPGGSLHFVEHSLAPSDRVARVQRRMQPTWGRLAGGCHLDRDIPAELASAGLVAPDLRTRYASGFWPARPFGWFATGSAVPQGA